MILRPTWLAAAMALVGATVASCGTGSPSASPTEPIDPAGEDGGLADDDDAAVGDSGVEAGDGAAPEDDGVLTVVSANLHCLMTSGTAHATNASRAEAVAALVARERVDVLATQELCVRAGGESMAELMLAALRRAAPGEWVLRSEPVHIAWSGTPDEAQQLMGIFARVPLGPGRAIVHRSQGALRRVSLGARVTAGAAPPLDVFDVHFDHQDGEVRTQQARELAVRAVLDSGGVVASEAAEVSALLVGDFNARAGESSYGAALAAGFVDVAGGASTKRIDHAMLHRAAPWESVEHAVVLDGADAVSDHPLVLFRLRPRAAMKAPLTIVSTPDRGRSLSLRGDRAPLSWASGWPLLAGVRPSSLLFATTELKGRAEVKLLVDDVTYQEGANVAVESAGETAIEPTFP